MPPTLIDLTSAASYQTDLSCLTSTELSSSELAVHFSPYDLKRLELYSRSMVDYHLIMDLVPTVARLFFLKQLGDLSLSAAQCVSFSLFQFFVVCYREISLGS